MKWIVNKINFIIPIAAADQNNIDSIRLYSFTGSDGVHATAGFWYVE